MLTTPIASDTMHKKTAILLTAAILGLTGCSKHIETPTVVLNGATFNDGTLSVNARITDDGGELTDAGIFYQKGVTNTPHTSGTKRSIGPTNNIELTLNLNPGPYSICAYATNIAGTGYSNATVVGDYAVTGGYSISSDKKSITISGEAYAPQGTTFSTVGFIWSTDPHDGWLREVSGFTGKTEAKFQTTISVQPGQTFYYYVMFQTNKGGYYYGDRRQVYIN